MGLWLIKRGIMEGQDIRLWKVVLNEPIVGVSKGHEDILRF